MGKFRVKKSHFTGNADPSCKWEGDPEMGMLAC